MKRSLEVGVCLDALNPNGCPEPSTYPFAWARLVAYEDDAFYEYCGLLQSAGIKVALVLARETFAGQAYGPVAARLAARIKAELWVVGNEMDAGLLENADGSPAYSPASWELTPDEYADLFIDCARAIRYADPTAIVILGGFVAGQPEAAALYAEPIQHRGMKIDGLDIHPYGKVDNAAAELVDDYRAVTVLTPYVLEWNRSAAEIPEYVEALALAGVPLVCYFAWSYNDGATEWGLIDSDGTQTPEFEALVKFGVNNSNTILEGPMAEFALGFKSYADAHPEVGTPLEDEGPIGDVQLTSAGVLLYFPRANTVRFIPFQVAAAR